MSVRVALERLVAGVDGYVATGCPDGLVEALEAARAVLAAPAAPALPMLPGRPHQPQLVGPEARGVERGQEWRNRRTGRVSRVTSVYLQRNRDVVMVGYVSTSGSRNTGHVGWFLETFEPAAS